MSFMFSVRQIVFSALLERRMKVASGASEEASSCKGAPEFSAAG
jgi:hypothetical protein